MYMFDLLDNKISKILNRGGLGTFFWYHQQEHQEAPKEVCDKNCYFKKKYFEKKNCEASGKL